jgi:hypothetical protein
MTGSFVHRWLRGPDLRGWRELNSRLLDLEFVLGKLHERLENGPIPGGYVVVPLVVGNVQLNNATHSHAAAQVIEADMRPIFFSLFVGGSDPVGLTNVFEVFVGSTAVLASAISHGVGTNLTTTRSSRSDFAVDTISGGSLVRLSVTNSTNVGAYSRNIHGRLVCKHVGKIEPA